MPETPADMGPEEASDSNDGLARSDRIRFTEFQVPPMDAGDYMLRVVHEVSAGDGDAVVYQPEPLHFSVTGERFTLGDGQIGAMYPPQGSTTDCSHHLPHVVLTRSTLPWERNPGLADGGRRSPPWLALVVFAGAEAPVTSIVEAGTLARKTTAADRKPTWPGLLLESAQHETDPVTVIDVPRRVLEPLLPAYDELRLQAHVRGVAHGETPDATWDEDATVFAARLPTPGSSHVAHLVSLEGRYALPRSAPAAGLTLATEPGCAEVAAFLAAARAQLTAPSTADGPDAWAAGRPSWERGDLPVVSLRYERVWHREAAPGSTGPDSEDWHVTLTAEIGCDHLRGGTNPTERLDDLKPRTLDAALDWCAALLNLHGRLRGIAAGPTPDHAEFTVAIATLGRVAIAVTRTDQPPIDETHPAPGLAGDRRNVSASLRFAFLPQDPVFDFGGATADQPVRLVSLRSWSFSCASEGADLARMIDALDLNTGAAAGVHGTMHHTVEVPEPARPFLAAGYTVLPHRTRGGEAIASWYRGPLVPRAPATSTAPTGVRGADQLLVFDAATGLFDASFAAAWTLGRLTALEDTAFAVELLHWKQRRRRARYVLHGRALHPEAPASGPAGDPREPPPPQVLRWFRARQRLEGLPFSYLVPDERLLPVESLRFFTVDPDWMACLLDGAFSIGRVLPSDEVRDEGEMERQIGAPRYSGILLRSEIVRGFPGLHVDGWTRPAPAVGETPDAALWHASHLDPTRYTRVPLIRRERLGPDVLLCLFAGDLDLVELHNHPTSVHFGFDAEGDGLVRQLRGVDVRFGTSDKVPVTVRDARVVALRGLYEDVASAVGPTLDHRFTPADFAFQMLDAPPLRRVLRDRTPPVGGTP